MDLQSVADEHDQEALVGERQVILGLRVFREGSPVVARRAPVGSGDVSGRDWWGGCGRRFLSRLLGFEPGDGCRILEQPRSLGVLGLFRLFSQPLPFEFRSLGFGL